MRTDQQTHLANSLLLPLNYVQMRGVDTADALAGTAITANMLNNPHEQFSIVQELQFYNNVQKILNDPLLGFQIGQLYSFYHYGAWGYSLKSASTVREAIQIGYRFIPLAFSYFKHELQEANNQASMLMMQAIDLGECQELLAMRELVSANQLLREVTESDFPLLSVDVSYPKPESRIVKIFEKYFGCGLRFNQKYCQLNFERSVLEQVLPQRDSILVSSFIQQCEQLSEKLCKPNQLSNRIELLIYSKPGHFTNIDTISGMFHLTPRTLRRRLQQEGTSFREIVNRSRQKLAEDLLKNTAMSVDDISNRLGYSEASNFSHAFKRLAGHSPKDFRAKFKNPN